MDLKQLQRLLRDVPNAREITIKGRRDTILSCSVPMNEIPKGWRMVPEMDIQRIPGFVRVRAE